MRSLVLGLTVAGLSISAILFSACGSDSSVDVGDGGGDDGGEGGNASSGGPAADCKVNGSACAGSGECCTAHCDVTSKQCVAAAKACKPPGDACANNTDCCTTSCVGGKCATKQCTPDNAACTSDGQCCGGKCTSGACVPLSTTSKTTGNPCTTNANCASTFCDNGICGQPSFCVQNGDACAADVDCCGGACTKAAGSSLGLCGIAAAPGAGGCTTAGTVCSPGGACNTNPCCSRSCEPYAATAVDICQPPSGCHPTGELCQKDTDCCGAAGLPTGEPGGVNDVNTTCSKAPGATIGRCSQGHKCSPAGSICRLAAFSCQATDRCCSGTVQQVKTNCVQDNLGIPRCLVETAVNCAASPPPAGTACASSADCCNKPCAPDATGKLVCAGTACIPVGGGCSTTADCCSGSPCVLAPGSTIGTCGPSGSSSGGTDGGSTSSSSSSSSSSSGGSSSSSGGSTTCSQYGQQCDATHTCCNAVPCTNGFCVTPVN